MVSTNVLVILIIIDGWYFLVVGFGVGFVSDESWIYLLLTYPYPEPNFILYH